MLSVLALVLAACGADGEGDSSDTTAEVESAEVSGGDDWPETITFAAVPSEQQERLEESYGVTTSILEDELGVSIEFFQAADYAGVIEGMIAGNVHIAQFGPFSYVIARNNGAEIEPAAAMINDEGGQPGYQSYAITQGDNSEINSLEDFAGKRVCFVDPGSTSGFLYPSAGLLDVGIDPETGVDAVFAGGHDASAISVANGDCDAGFAFDTMVTSVLIDEGDISEGDLKVVWESEIIAGSPVAMQTSIPDDLRAAIQETFVNKVNVSYAVENGYCASADDCSLSDEDIWGYVVVDDDYYGGVRTVCEITEAPACEG
jgi:phosphonate transport system substrate-binding protein